MNIQIQQLVAALDSYDLILLQKLNKNFMTKKITSTPLSKEKPVKRLKVPPRSPSCVSRVFRTSRCILSYEVERIVMKRTLRLDSSSSFTINKLLNDLEILNLYLKEQGAVD